MRRGKRRLSTVLPCTESFPHVIIAAASDPDRLLLSVSDEGWGIPYSDQERVFERFYRVDKGRARKTGGTGLGLAIVRHAAIVHGGEVRLDSIPEHGSTFTITIPREKASTEDA